MKCFDRIIAPYGDDGTLWFSVNAPRYLAALFQLLLHLLSWQVDVDGEVWSQELTDANAFDLVIVLHTCKPRNTCLINVQDVVCNLFL